MDERLRQLNKKIEDEQAGLEYRIALVRIRKKTIKQLNVEKLKRLEELMVIRIAFNKKEIKEVVLQDNIPHNGKRFILFVSETGYIKCKYSGIDKEYRIDYDDEKLIAAINITAIIPVVDVIFKSMN